MAAILAEDSLNCIIFFLIENHRILIQISLNHVPKSINEISQHRC